MAELFPLGLLLRRRPTKAGTLMRKREFRDTDEWGDGFGGKSRRCGFSGLPTPVVVDVGENEVVTGEIASTPLYPLVLDASGEEESAAGERGTSRTDAANASVDGRCC